jgi:hypothetical protein
LTIRLLTKSAEVRNSMLKDGMNDGWSQTLDRLAETSPKIKK